jgi:hypothetical protein
MIIRYATYAGAAALSLLTVGTASAIPFVRQDSAPDCSPFGTGTVCTFVLPTVPASHRWNIQFVTCSNNLLNPDTSREGVTLRSYGGAAFPAYALLPNKITNSNSWVVSQEVVIPLNPGQHAEILIQSNGGGIVASAGNCTISGEDETLP